MENYFNIQGVIKIMETSQWILGVHKSMDSPQYSRFYKSKESPQCTSCYESIKAPQCIGCYKSMETSQGI